MMMEKTLIAKDFIEKYVEYKLKSMRQQSYTFKSGLTNKEGVIRNLLIYGEYIYSGNPIEKGCWKTYEQLGNKYELTPHSIQRICFQVNSSVKAFKNKMKIA